MAEISFGTLGQWRHYELPGQTGTLHVKGYLHQPDEAHLPALLAAAEPSQFPALLAGLDGHFALVLETRQGTLAATDKVGSIPLFLLRAGDCWRVGDNATQIAALAGLGQGDVDANAALAIAMSAYSIGDATLYQPMKSLLAGEMAWFGSAGDMRRQHYYRYAPWLAEPGDFPSRIQALADVTLGVLQKLLHSVGDRQIVIPLSAGHDSRLIASGLKHLGATKVKCFTYGIPGNFEARISAQVAAKLGYPWRLVPLTHSGERRFYRSEAFAGYWQAADTCIAAPYFQGLSATQYLKESGWIDADAVFVNGNTGDFISGGHIPECLVTPKGDWEQQLQRLLDAFVAKHFSLWQSLLTPANIAQIQAQLRQQIDALATENIPHDAAHGVYEYLELTHRQAKYILANQRIYEFYGYDWRLPLWDDAYLQFWEKVPAPMKYRQRLYKAMLYQHNWGGVWDKAQPPNRLNIRPLWLVPLRSLAKCAFAPFGKPGRRAWKRFELRVFYYWREVSQMTALFRYRQILTDRRGFQHIIAFVAERYLAMKGVKMSRFIN